MMTIDIWKRVLIANNAYKIKVSARSYQITGLQKKGY
jgi:hypothetical protein